MAKVAVLLAVYNAEKYLEECLNSITAQTWQDWELFACNDGSKDSSLSIMERYAVQDKRIHILNNEKNIGIVATRNRLIGAIPADAGYAAWVDSDDICFPERLQKQVEFLEKHPEIGAVGADLEIIDENSNTTGYRHYPETPGEIRRQLPVTNVIAQPVLMLRSSVIKATGLYTSEYPVCEDYDYWLRVLEKFEFANIGEPLLRYRISTTQCKQSRLKEMLKLTLQIQKDHYRRTGQKMPLAGKLRQLAGKILLLLPAELILKIFCLMTYKNAQK